MGKPGALGIYDEFPGYRIFEEPDREEALKDALVAVDANVLLNLYRYNQQTRDDLLKVLERMGARLWVPHQAMREFWRNRASVMANRSSATSTAVAALRKQARAAEDAIRAWQRATAVDDALATRLVEDIGATLDEATKVVQSEDPARRESFKVAAVDPVLRKLEVVLDGRVGRAMDAATWKAAVAEGRRRVENEEPPGYLDAAKADTTLAEGPAGDYLVWRQLLDEAKMRGKTTFLVTNDEKEDWWHRYNTERLGPRPELVVEFAEAVRQPFHMLTTADLLRAAEVFDVAVDFASIEDAERIERSGAEVAGWTEDGTDALLDALEAEDSYQYPVMCRAALNGGTITRAEVYKICGFSQGRSLRGFTRPVTRITTRLQSQGIVHPEVTPALVAVYGGTPEAESFRIPPEMVEQIADSLVTYRETGE